MFTARLNRGFVPSALCLLLAMTIVGACLTCGALGVESLASTQTSTQGVVTITQIA